MYVKWSAASWEREHKWHTINPSFNTTRGGKKKKIRINFHTPKWSPLIVSLIRHIYSSTFFFLFYFFLAEGQGGVSGQFGEILVSTNFDFIAPSDDKALSDNTLYSYRRLPPAWRDLVNVLSRTHTHRNTHKGRIWQPEASTAQFRDIRCQTRSYLTSRNALENRNEPEWAKVSIKKNVLGSLFSLSFVSQREQQEVAPNGAEESPSW